MVLSSNAFVTKVSLRPPSPQSQPWLPLAALPTKRWLRSTWDQRGMTAHHFPFQLLSLLRATRCMLIFREFEHPLVQRASNSISIKP